MKGSDAFRKSPGMPEDNSFSERSPRSDKGYSEVRVGHAINKRDLDSVAGKARQVSKGKSKPKIK